MVGPKENGRPVFTDGTACLIRKNMLSPRFLLRYSTPGSLAHG